MTDGPNLPTVTGDQFRAAEQLVAAHYNAHPATSGDDVEAFHAFAGLVAGWDEAVLTAGRQKALGALAEVGWDGESPALAIETAAVVQLLVALYALGASTGALAALGITDPGAHA